MKRAGVGATLIEHDGVQGALFDTIDREKQQRLQAAVDNLHAVIGEHSLRLASQTDPSSVVSSEHRSPHYTTRLSDVIEVKWAVVMTANSERRNEIKWTGAFARLILQKHIRYILEYFSPFCLYI